MSKKENGKNKTKQNLFFFALHFASLSLLGENGKHDKFKFVPMGYRFKSDSEHTCLVKMVDTIVLKFVPMGYWFESDNEYPNV